MLVVARTCVCVCVCECVCVCVCVCMHAYMRAYVHVCMRLCMHAHVLFSFCSGHASMKCCVHLRKFLQVVKHNEIKWCVRVCVF